MDAVRDDGVPQQISNRRGARKERDRPIEVFRLQLSDPRDRLSVNSVIARRECFNTARSLDARRFRLHRELTVLDAVTDVRVTFGEMPRELAKGATTSVRP